MAEPASRWDRKCPSRLSVGRLVGRNPEVLILLQRKGDRKGNGAGNARPRAFVVDEASVVAEEAFDGVWALRINAPLEATEVA